ncbi:hypothetical protein FPV67DRAFT_786597 [Lyophyllum atratum]|nr:hypothetical protein FPV67DRAFT_786597 [Lyophyllum atratum]
MLFCFPLHKFRLPTRRTRRTRTAKDMHLHSEEDARTESGIYYLVPNKYAPGKTLVRRPRPPPTSAPLDDDFDAATTTRGARTEWEPHGLGSERARSPSPLASNSGTPKYALAPRTASPVATPNAQSQTRSNTPLLRRKDGARPLSGGGTTNTNRKDDADAFETYGEYGHYMTELERKFGGSPDLTLSPTRNRQEQDRSGGHVQIAATANTSGGISRIGKPSRLGSVNRLGLTTGVGGGVGAIARARQSFEIVDRRVLEDGPERTVTISTWREQVADEADPTADMEVYYLGANDYAEAADGGSEVGAGGDGVTSVSEADARRRRRSLPPRPTEDAAGSNLGSIRTITDEQSKSSGPTSVRHTATTSTSTTTRKSSGHTSHSHADRTKPSVSGSSSSPSWTRTPPRTPPRNIRTPDPSRYRSSSRSPSYQKLTNGTHGTDTRTSPAPSSTPIRHSLDAIRPDRSSHTPLRSSTPNRMYARHPTPSFHPTQSGSTISTIKSTSTIAFEQVLASCEPPLLHISPALAKLGIMNEGHLRAVARLSEETRDREVREEALRQGVTVMEWAILLDKLHEL